MWCGKSEKCCSRLCPFSFGLALGLVGFFSVFFWSLWAMKYGIPPEMMAHMDKLTLSGAFVHALYVLFKGFIFGFFVALFYDWISCWCMARCCKKSGDSCDSGASKS